MNPHAPAPQLSLKILLGIALVGVLYVGRSVLAPITLAAMLGFVMAPVVRQIRRLGLGQGSAAIGALVVVGVLVAGIALVIFAQLGEMSRDLPRYESHLREKAYTLRELTIGRLQDMQGRVGKIVGNLVPAAPTTPASDTHWASIDRPPSTTGAENPSPAVLGPFLSALWGSLGTLGVVVLVLVFALLEQDSLRDRLIRLTGGRDVRAMVVGIVPGEAWGSPGWPPALVAGRRVTRGHYEAMADIATGFGLGDTVRIRRNEYTVIGLTRRMVSSSGHPMVFIPLKDAQEAQFLKDNDAIVQNRARTAANPAFNRPGVPGLLPAINASQTSSNTVNAVLVRLRPGADPDEVAESVRRWKRLTVYTRADMEDILIGKLIATSAKQIGMFLVILAAVSAAIVAFIIYSLTLVKIRVIAVL